MKSARKRIKVSYSSTNEKELKDAIASLIKVHEGCAGSGKKSDELPSVI